MSIISTSYVKPQFSANKLSFKADGDNSVSVAERAFVEEGWRGDKSYDDQLNTGMSLTNKILIGAGVALLALAVTLRIVKPDTVKAFAENKKWIPNFLKSGLGKTSEFLNKYTLGAGSEGAWGKLFGRTKAPTPTTEPLQAPVVAPATPKPIPEAPPVKPMSSPVDTPPAATPAAKETLLDPKRMTTI